VVFSSSHLDVDDESNTSKLGKEGYLCPQCGSKYCELPVECRACGLTLVSAPHLARSYHHLFPIDNFDEVELKDSGESICFACQRKYSDVDKHVGATSILSFIISNGMAHSVNENAA